MQIHEETGTGRVSPSPGEQASNPSDHSLLHQCPLLSPLCVEKPSAPQDSQGQEKCGSGGSWVWQGGFSRGT